jgi:predicted GNAT family acetyltransferase
MSETTEIVDDRKGRRFVYRGEGSGDDGTEAQLQYRVNGTRLILVHTEVPESMAGRGVGGRLVRAAAERAKASGETVLPWCPYARKWLQDHPEVTAGITIDWSEPPR